jgi:hypothetical protein
MKITFNINDKFIITIIGILLMITTIVFLPDQRLPLESLEAAKIAIGEGIIFFSGFLLLIISIFSGEKYE